jgi:hypothetical protein
MTGHFSSGEHAKVRWADAELQGVSIDYDAVSLRVRESCGSMVVLRAEGYIGYKLVGFWDEVVIVRAEVTADHLGLDECARSIEQRLGPRWLDSGSDSRNRRDFFALLVHFSDGSVLEVYAAQLRVESRSELSGTPSGDAR